LADRRVRRVAKALSIIRTGVYFSLGAGPMGWIALARGEGAIKAALWSLVSGILIAVLARGLRRLVRRDLDSTLKTKDFLMSTATVLVPIEPGAMGKVRVRLYGVETDLFARLRSGSAQKGDLVTIVDYDDESCIVERQEPTPSLPE
jgi:membrane protein implicated in regulation of membrane protease activity